MLGAQIPFGAHMRVFTETDGEMEPLYVIAGVVALALLVYLIIAMLKPEIFP